MLPYMEGGTNDETEELTTILTRLRIEATNPSAETIQLVARVLELTEAAPFDVFSFVEGPQVRSVQREWGDNEKSYWAHLYMLPSESEAPDVLVTLERDGGVGDLIGIFPSRADALEALRRRGKYEAV